MRDGEPPDPKNHRREFVTTMCFSPEGDLIGGLVVTAIVLMPATTFGSSRVPIDRSFPILLGLHQIDETFVWWQLQGHVPHASGVVACGSIYSSPFVALPTLVPTMVLLLEPRGRRRVIAPFLALGVVTSALLLETMLSGHPAPNSARITWPIRSVSNTVS